MENRTRDSYTEEQKAKCFELRVKTGEGLMTCKDLLKESNWDIEAAYKLYWSEEWLEYRVNKGKI